MSLRLSFLSVLERVSCDVGDMVVREGIDDLPTLPIAAHEAHAAQDTQVLRDDGLGGLDAIDQLVDASWTVRELQDQGETDRTGDGLEHITGGTDFGGAGRRFHVTHSRIAI
jgi:hypothetical protein